VRLQLVLKQNDVALFIACIVPSHRRCGRGTSSFSQFRRLPTREVTFDATASLPAGAFVWPDISPSSVRLAEAPRLSGNTKRGHDEKIWYHFHLRRSHGVHLSTAQPDSWLFVRLSVAGLSDGDIA
jgi:hypothetical protein